MRAAFALALMLAVASSSVAVAAPGKKAVAPKAAQRPVFSFMGQTTEAARTMSELAGNACQTDKATTTCSQYGGDLAGKPISFLIISFYNDRLYQIIGSAKKWAFPDLLAAFTTKYGSPEVHSEKWQNKMGATFDNTVAVWKFKGGNLELRELGTQIDDTDFTFTAPANGPPEEPVKVDF